MTKLLRTEELEQSPVVANCAMNRERVLLGSGGYEGETGFNPLAFLAEQLKFQRVVRWLDLCCGSARAIHQAARTFDQDSNESTETFNSGGLLITGVDLVGMFSVSSGDNLELIECSVLDYQPQEPFDLITCVHGLHYIGDKLTALQLAASWLRPRGRFVANLDTQNICLNQAGQGSRKITRLLRDAGFEYDARNKRVSRFGQLSWECPLRFVGADDRAGPNYTQQPVVDSVYRFPDSARTTN